MSEEIKQRIAEEAKALGFHSLGVAAIPVNLRREYYEQWIADGKPSQVPDAVQSWADAAGMTPEEAADDIGATALSWEGVLATVRQARLSGKAALNSASSRTEQVTAAAEQVALINALMPA